VPDQLAALVAAGQHEAPGRAAVPEGGRLEVAVRAPRRQEGSVAHASATPRISVELIIRVDSAPPVPWASASCTSGTCTAGLASPRTWRTASMIFVIPPRFAG